jgi:hypothetical protein
VKDAEKELDRLVHDVNSRCSSLRDAAAMLRKIPSSERAEFLALMTEQARKLADDLAQFKPDPA